MSELQGRDDYTVLHCRQGTGKSWVEYKVPGHAYMEEQYAAWKIQRGDWERRIKRVLTRLRIWMRLGIRKGIINDIRRRSIEAIASMDVFRARVQQVIDPGYVGIRRLRRITPIRK